MATTNTGLPGFQTSNLGVGSNSGYILSPQEEAISQAAQNKNIGQILGAVGKAINTIKPTGGLSLGIANNLERIGGMMNPPPEQPASQGFDMKYYPGWNDVKAAQVDWIATNGEKGRQANQQQQPAPDQRTPAPTRTVNIGGRQVAIGGNAIQSVLDTFQNSDYSNFASQMSPEEFGAQIDATYQPSLDVLNQAQGYLQQQQPGVEQGIASQNALNQKQLGDTRLSQVNTLNSNKNTAIQRKESALAAARRLYSELQQGARQRYGSASSAGEGANILMGNEQQRQMGETQRATQNALGEIDRQGVELESNYNTQKMQLETQFQGALRDAQSEFQNKLLQINSNKAQTEQAKGQARLQNLVDLRNQANAINAQKMQYAQQLDLMKQQSAISLQEYKAKLGQAGTNSANSLGRLMNSTSTNPTAYATLPGQNGATQQSTINNSTGIMSYNPSGVFKNKDQLGGGVYGIQSLPDGRTRYSDGSVR